MGWNVRNAMLCLVVMAAAVRGSAGAESSPFTVGIEFPSQVPVSKAVENALREMGIGYLNTYVTTMPGNRDAPPSETAAAVMDLCSRLQIDFSLATHLLDPPDETRRSGKPPHGELLQAARGVFGGR